MTEEGWSSLKLQNRILLYLKDTESINRHDKYIKNNSYDYIVKKIGSQKKNLHDKLRKIEKEELVLRKKENIDDEEIEYYCLTEKGREKSEKIWNEIKGKTVKLIDEKDVVYLKLEVVSKILEDESLFAKLKNIKDQTVLDLRNENEEIDSLVGRDEEVGYLENTLEEIKKENGKTVFISGSTGIGKTTLVEHVKKKASEKEFNFLKGKCHVEDFTPYGPIESALEKILKMDMISKESQGVISTSYPNFEKPQNKKMFDSQRKSVFYDTTELLKRLSEKRPLVIFLDDLQWADKGTLNLMDYMADRLQDEAVLIIGAYRAGDVSKKDPLKKVIRKMSRKKLFDKIELSSLSEEEVVKLISNITSVEETKIPEDFVESIQNITNGNPLFIKESVTQMIEEGKIDSEKEDFPDKAEIKHIPNMVQNVLRKRIFKLSDESRDILQLGSVIGKIVPFDLLVESSEKDELELLEEIDVLLESDIWEEHPREDSFVFSHDLFVDTIYEGLGKWLERKRLHRKVAEAIEIIYENRIEEKYPILGHHYLKGEKYEKAFKYFMKAGKKAEEVFANEDAIEMYKQALSLAEKISKNEEDKIEIIERIVRSSNLLGKYEGVRKYLKKALFITDDEEIQQRIYRKMAESYKYQGEWDKSLKFIEKGLDLDGEENPEVCKLLSLKGWAYMEKDNYNKAENIFKKEKEVAESLNNKKMKAQVFHDLGTNALSKGDYKKSIEKLKKALKIREEIDDTIGLEKTYNNLGIVYRKKGNLDNGENYYKKSLEICDKIGYQAGTAITLNNIAIIQKEKGELSQAEENYKKSLELSEKIGDLHLKSLSLRNIANLQTSQGELEASGKNLKKSYALQDKIGDKVGKINLLLVESKLEKKRGNLNEAKEKLIEAKDIAKEIGDQRNLASIYKGIGTIFLLKDNIEEAKNILEKGREIAVSTSARDIEALSIIRLSEIKLKEGEMEEAEEMVREGLETVKDLGLNRLIVIYQNRLARIYLEREKLNEADEILSSSEEKITKIENPSPLIENKKLLGELYREHGEFDKAENYLHEALKKSKDIKSKIWKAKILYELGLLELSRNEKQKAESYFRDASDIFQELDMISWENKVEKHL